MGTDDPTAVPPTVIPSPACAAISRNSQFVYVYLPERMVSLRAVLRGRAALRETPLFVQACVYGEHGQTHGLLQ